MALGYEGSKRTMNRFYEQVAKVPSRCRLHTYLECFFKGLEDTLQWCIKKTCQVIWDTLQNYVRMAWERTLKDLEKALHVAYQDVFSEFDSMWGGGSKALL